MLVRLPWGDYVNDGAVSAITIDRSGVGFVVCVSLDREGMEVRSGAYHDLEDVKALVEAVAALIDPCLPPFGQ